MKKQLIILAIIAGLFVIAGAAYAEVPQVCDYYFGDSVCDDTAANCGANYKTGTSYDACRECSTFKNGNLGFANCVSSGTQQIFSGIYSPQGGEQWPVASTHTIQWETSGFGANVKLNIFLATRTCVSSSNGACINYAYPYAATVVNGISNSGSYSWTVQTSISTGDYFLIICNNDDGCNQRYISQGSIQIYTPTTTSTNVRDVSPSGVQVFKQGTANVITWKGGKNKVQLSLVAPDYYQSGISGQIIGFIGEGIPDSQLTWNGVVIYGGNQQTLSYIQPGSGPYKILAISEGPQGGYCGALGTSVCNANVSTGTFTITPSTTSVSLTAPKTGDLYQVGGGMLITWQIQDIPAEANSRVFLQMIKVENGAETGFIQLTGDGSAPNTGTFSWTIPSWVSPGTYKIKIKPNCSGPSTLTGCFASAQSGMFTIQAAAIQPSNFAVTFPAGGEQWQLGTTKTVLWNDPDFTSATAYSIFAEKNTGSVTGIGGVQGTRQFTWTVGNVPGSSTTLQLGTYRIVVVRQGTPSAQQAKSAQFSIVSNQPPAVTAAGPASAVVGGQFTLTGTATDTDGTIASLSWAVSGSTTGCTITQSAATGLGTASASRTASVTCLATGSKSFVLAATDNSGSSGQATKEVIVSRNQAPTLTVTGVDTRGAGLPFTIVATATDDVAVTSLAPQALPAGCTQNSATPEGIGTTTAHFTLVLTCATAGQKTITFEVNDGVNAAVSASKTVSIQGTQNQPPVVTIAGPAGANTNQQFALTATATDDTAVTTLAPQFVSTGCSVINIGSPTGIGTTTATITSTFSCSSTGQKTITFEANDGVNAAVRVSKTVTIGQQIQDTAPTLTISGPESANSNQQFTLMATAIDDNAVTGLLPQFVSTGCTIINIGTPAGIGTATATITSTFSCATAGQKTITFEASDDVNAAVRVSKAVTVAAGDNNLPGPPQNNEQLGTFQLNLKKGWNLFSTPITDSTTTSFFSYETTCQYASPLRKFDKIAVIYTRTDTIIGGAEGYWIKVAGDCKVIVKGNGIITLDNFFGNGDGLSLTKGWNVVGGTPSELAFDQIRGTCTFARRPYSYNPVSNNYERPATMEPGKGYLILVDNDCVMKLADEPPPPPLPVQDFP